MKKLSLEVLNPNCAGIDVGSRFHMVAVGQKAGEVRRFGVYTEDHHTLIHWLKECKITSIAMESTGSYWQTLFDALQNAEFEVLLVNGNQVKNVKGKKTDVLDCMWIQKLHSLGLLRGSFLPGSELQKLRTYYNHRQHLVRQTSRYINKMQKALRLMNIRLDVVINDIMGKSGRAIIEAILSGERDPYRLSLLANYRVKKSKEEIAQSLEGNWREDLLFEVRECLFLHDVYCDKIEVCDRQIEEKIKLVVKEYSEVRHPFGSLKKSKTPSKFSPTFDIEGLAHRYFGINLFEIGGVSHNTVLCLLTHMGQDIDKFPSSKHFCSWLRLSPNNKVSGGKILSSRTPKGKSVLSLALRQAANSIGNQRNHPMAPFFRRVAFKKGRGAAVTATARKLAGIIYTMITKKESYQPFDYAGKIEQIKAKRIAKIKNQLAVLKPDELKSLFQDYSSSIT
jgi:transposase